MTLIESPPPFLVSIDHPRFPNVDSWIITRLQKKKKKKKKENKSVFIEFYHHQPRACNVEEYKNTKDGL